ncbi:MAG: beta strand repeat-containing protein [Panacagrimonas sp.]
MKTVPVSRSGFPLNPFLRALLPLMTMPGLALATPTGGVVVGGNAAISQQDVVTTVIDQSSAAAAINWQSFNVGGNEFVVFNQPSASSVTLNRVVGGDVSTLLGTLSANGRVFLVNPAGVLFGQGATVDVGGLVASTLDISVEDFFAGNYVFAQPAAQGGRVENAGRITAADGGFVVLAGAEVRNTGLIQGRLGTVALTSGSALTLDVDGSGLVGYEITQGTLSEAAGVSNVGEILAQGGRVVMAANLARELIGSVVNNQGVVRAQGMAEEDGGGIVLTATGGNITQSGTLDVSAGSGQAAGSIDILSDRDISLTAGSRIDATGPSAGAVRVIAERSLSYEAGALTDIARESDQGFGGFAELSGRQEISIEGHVALGDGGTLVFDPGDDFAIGGPILRLRDISENSLETILREASSSSIVSVVGASSVTLLDLEDGVLDGTSTLPGFGAGLLLGVGTTSRPDPRPSTDGVYTRGAVGSIRFVDSNDAIRVGGALIINTGTDAGTVNVGALDARSIFIDSANDITTGDLLSVGSVDLVTLDGQIRAGNISVGAGSLDLRSRNADLGDDLSGGFVSGIALDNLDVGGSVTLETVDVRPPGSELPGAGLGITAAEVSAAGSLIVSSTRDIQLGSVEVSNAGGLAAVDIRARNGALSTGAISISGSAGGDGVQTRVALSGDTGVTLDGDLSLADADGIIAMIDSRSGDMSIGGTISGGRVFINANTDVTADSDVTLGELRNLTELNLAVGGQLNLTGSGSLSVAEDIFIEVGGGDIDFADISSGAGSIFLSTGLGNINTESVSAAGHLYAFAGQGDLAMGLAHAGAGMDLSTRNGQISVASLTLSGGSLIVESRNADVGDDAGGGFVSGITLGDLNVPGSVALSTFENRPDSSAAIGLGGSISVGDISAQGGVSIDVSGSRGTHGGDISLGAIQVESDLLGSNTLWVLAEAGSIRTGSIAMTDSSQGNNRQARILLGGGGEVTIDGDLSVIDAEGGSASLFSDFGDVSVSGSVDVGDFSVSAGGDLNLGRVDGVDRGLSLLASGQLRLASTDLSVSEDLSIDVGDGSVQFHSLAAGVVLSVNVRQGDLSLTTASAGFMALQTPNGRINLGGPVTTDGDFVAVAGGDLNLADLAVGGTTSLGAGGNVNVNQASGDLVIDTLVADGANLVASDGRIEVASFSTGDGDVVLSSTNADAADDAAGGNVSGILIGDLAAGGDIDLRTQNLDPVVAGVPDMSEGIRAGNLSAGGSLTAITQSGDLVLGTVASGDALRLDSGGGLSLADSSIDVAGSVEVSAGSGDLMFTDVTGNGVDLLARNGRVDVQRVDARAGDLAVHSVNADVGDDADGPVSGIRLGEVAEVGGSITLGTLDIGPAGSAAGGFGITAGNLSAGGSVSVSASSGDIQLGGVSSRGDLAILAQAGGVNLSDPSLVAAGTLAVSAATGDLEFATVDGSTVNLFANDGRIRVDELAAGAGGAMLISRNADLADDLSGGPVSGLSIGNMVSGGSVSLVADDSAPPGAGASTPRASGGPSGNITVGEIRVIADPDQTEEGTASRIEVRASGLLTLDNSEISGDGITLQAGDIRLSNASITGGPVLFSLQGPDADLSDGGSRSAILADSLLVSGARNILLGASDLSVGSGLTPEGTGDAALLAELARRGLAPGVSIRPNAALLASDTLSLGSLALEGDHLLLQGNAVSVGSDGLRAAGGLLLQLLPGDPEALVSLENLRAQIGDVNFGARNDFPPPPGEERSVVVIGGSAFDGDILVGQNGRVVPPPGTDLVLFTSGNVTEFRRTSRDNGEVVIIGNVVRPPPRPEEEEVSAQQNQIPPPVPRPVPVVEVDLPGEDLIEQHTADWGIGEVCP